MNGEYTHLTPLAIPNVASGVFLKLKNIIMQTLASATLGCSYVAIRYENEISICLTSGEISKKDFPKLLLSIFKSLGIADHTVVGVEQEDIQIKSNKELGFLNNEDRGMGTTFRPQLMVKDPYSNMIWPWKAFNSTPRQIEIITINFLLVITHLK
jgi:hypothetical protein